MGFFGRIRARFALLFALCLFAVVFAVPASAQEEYRITATLQAPELEEGAGFGGSVAVGGDIIVVSKPFATVEGKGKAGRAHIFDTDGNLLETLQAPEPEARAVFGCSVAASGDVIAIGEPNADAEGKADAGKVYVFDPEGNLLATLQSPTPQADAYFGISVDVSGDIIAVGEPLTTAEGKVGAGRAYIFDSEGNLLETLQPPELEEGAKFGLSLAVSEDVVAVGEPLAEVEGKGDAGRAYGDAGRAYIFDSDGNLLATLQSPEPEEDAFFGDTVAVSGDVVAVGEPFADVEDKFQAGRVYLFDSSGNLLATLQSPTPQMGAWFGLSLAVSGDVVVVGEGARVEGKSMAGRAYIFDSSGNLLSTLQSPTPQRGGEFGSSHEETPGRILGFTLRTLAVSGDIVVIGERGADVEGVSDAGRAYIIRAGEKTLTPSPTPTPTADYAPYLMAAAVIVVIVAATAVYVKRRKRQ